MAVRAATTALRALGRPSRSIMTPLAVSRRWMAVSAPATSTVGASTAVNAAPQPKFSVVHHPVAEGETIAPADYFAVIKLGGTQYKVAQGDVVVAEKIKDAKVGEIMDLNEVLLLGNVNETCVGRPLVPGAKVCARVEEQTYDEKVDIFKKKRRKNYRRWTGFRRQVTILRITDIVPAAV